MKRPPRQVRLDEDVEAEVKKIADITHLTEVEVIRQTIRAGVLAIKHNNYLWKGMPLAVQVVEPPNPPTSPVRYSERPDAGVHLNEAGGKKKKSSSSKDSGHKLAQDIVKKALGGPPKAEQ